MELVTKIDSIMQEIQKDRGKPKNNATAATRMTTSATTTARTTTTSATMAPVTPTNANMINGMALASPTHATTTVAAPLNPTIDMMFAGLFGLTGCEAEKRNLSGNKRGTCRFKRRTKSYPIDIMKACYHRGRQHEPSPCNWRIC
jgi:hypothetical protein